MIFDKITIAALFTIAIFSSIIVVSAFIGSVSAFAAKKVKHHEYSMTLPIPFSGLPTASEKTKPLSRTSHDTDAGHLGWTIDISNSIPTEEMYKWKEICNT
jgi:hypothetical protein